MSVHMVPASYAGKVYEGSAVGLAGRAAANPDLRNRTDGLLTSGTDEDLEITFTYTPDLSPAELGLFDDYVASVRWNLPLAVYQARKADYAVVGANMARPSATRTQAERDAHTDALSRIVGSMLDRE